MSGANLAYHLRVNKHIDRCLFVESLRLVESYRPIRDYGYVSMGGNFLEDFRVIHQEFCINRMYSFDGSASVVTRQELNKPFGFIHCVNQESTEVVKNIDTLRSELFGKDQNLIFWLDYTDPRKRQQQLIDVEILLTNLIAGDIFRVTMNANRSQLGSNETYQRLKATGETEHTSLWNYRYDQLSNELGENLADDRKDANYLQNNHEFNVTLARCIKKAALKGIDQRPELRIQPLIAVAYSDGQEMITVTAIVLTNDESGQFWDHQNWIQWPYKPGANWDDFVEIDVPYLSQRERHAIHAAMKHGNLPTAEQLSFKLDNAEAKNARLFTQYCDHYLRYPTFVPIDSI